MIDIARMRIERLNAAGVPCGPIYTLDQTFADPQLVETMRLPSALTATPCGPLLLVDGIVAVTAIVAPVIGTVMVPAVLV